MNRTWVRHWPLGVAAAVAAVLTGQSELIFNAIPYWMTDYLVYRNAGTSILSGLPVYQTGVDTFFENMQFIYTPFAASVMVPFAALPVGLSKTVWTFLSFLALAGSVWASLRISGVTSRQRLTLLMALGVFAATFLAPVQHNMLLGQINVFLMVLVLVDFVPGLPERWRGIGTGIAAGIKLTPLIFLVYLFLSGRRRAALQGVASFAGTILVGFLVIPSDSRPYWLGGTFFASGRMVPSDTLVNHSLGGLFGRFEGTVPPPSWALAVSAAAGAACLVAALWAHRRGHDVVGMLVIAFAAQLMSPITWMHHGVWVVPALVWLALASWRAGTVLPRVLLALAVAWYVVPVWVIGMLPNSDGTPIQMTAGGNLLVTLTGNLAPAVVAIALMPVWLKRLRPAEPDRRDVANFVDVLQRPKV